MEASGWSLCENKMTYVEEVERGIRTCMEKGCKTDARYKIIEVEMLAWNEGKRVARYLCKKHFQEHENLTKEQTPNT
jgi:hypothetical protein